MSSAAVNKVGVFFKDPFWSTQRFIWREFFAEVQHVLAQREELLVEPLIPLGASWVCVKIIKVIEKYVPDKAEDAKQSLEDCTKQFYVGRFLDLRSDYETLKERITKEVKALKKFAHKTSFALQALQQKMTPLGPIFINIQDCWVDSFLAKQLTVVDQENIRKEVMARAASWPELPEYEYEAKVKELEMKRASAAAAANFTAAAPIKQNPAYGMAGIAVDAKHVNGPYSFFGRPIVPIDILPKAKPKAQPKASWATAAAPMNLGGFYRPPCHSCRRPPLMGGFHPYASQWQRPPIFRRRIFPWPGYRSPNL
jgi:hypothetical protein